MRCVSCWVWYVANGWFHLTKKFILCAAFHTSKMHSWYAACCLFLHLPSSSLIIFWGYIGIQLGIYRDCMFELIKKFLRKRVAVWRACVCVCHDFLAGSWYSHISNVSHQWSGHTWSVKCLWKFLLIFIDTGLFDVFLCGILVSCNIYFLIATLFTPPPWNCWSVFLIAIAEWRCFSHVNICCRMFAASWPYF